MAQCEICGQWDGKHSSNCPNYKGEQDKDTETPIDQEKEYCSECGELLPNHTTICPLYGSGVVIPDDKSICVNCGKLTSVSNDFKCENCGKSAVEVEEDPTTSEPIRGVGDKMCTNMELYEFAEDSSRPSNKNQCPSKRKWNNNYLGRWILTIDDHIKDNQLFALKNVVKELRPVNLVTNFDITSSRDADNLIFNLEIINTHNNPRLLTQYTEKGVFEIRGYYLDKTAKRWRKFKCSYSYSNKTSHPFRFNENGISISKEKGDFIQQPATGEYHNIDSWIKTIYLNGKIVYNSNYPVTLSDPTTDNPINLTFNISGNTDTSRSADNPIIMEINSGSSPYINAPVYLDRVNVKVKNPAFIISSYTAYIQYNGSIGERPYSDGRIKTKGMFNSTYKLVYDPKTPNDSTVSVERLSFAVKMDDGGDYYPDPINDIIVLGTGVKINKFESQLSTFDSMKLYYPKWSESENKYNMVSITAPLEKL